MISNKKQYFIFILLISLLTLGFLLMSGGSSPDPGTFNNDLFSFRRITLAPLVVIGSYIGCIWLLLKRPAN